MNKLCGQFVEWLESEAWELPQVWREHLQQCATCAKLWRQEQAYRNLVSKVRSEPVPNSRLAWRAIATRLPQPTPQSNRTVHLAWSLAISVILIIEGWWLLQNSTNRNEPLPAIAHKPTVPSSKPADTVKPNTEPTTMTLNLPTPHSDGVPSTSPSRRIARATPPKSEPPALTTPSDSEVAVMRYYRSEGTRSMGRSRGMERTPHTEVAMLPLEPIEPLDKEPVEYLPVQYGEPSTTHDQAGSPQPESNQEGIHDAILCSF